MTRVELGRSFHPQGTVKVKVCESDYSKVKGCRSGNRRMFNTLK